MFVGLNTEDVAERWACEKQVCRSFFMALAGFCKNRPYFLRKKGFVFTPKRPKVQEKPTKQKKYNYFCK